MRKAVASGRIPAGADGLIDTVAADRAWERNTDPAKQPLRDGDKFEYVSEPIAAYLDLQALLGEIEGPLFRVSGSQRVIKALVLAWAKVPAALDRLEDGLRAARVPLLERDMPHSDAIGAAR